MNKGQKEAGHWKGRGGFRELDPKAQLTEALPIIMNLTFKNSNGKTLTSGICACVNSSLSICLGQNQLLAYFSYKLKALS